MVLYDDKKWLSRLIRTAFILEDESGICEKVLKKKPYLGETTGDDDSDSASSTESFDIREGSDIGHRRRSNTAIRLEKLERQRKAHTEIIHVRLHPGELPTKSDLEFEKSQNYQDEHKQKSKNAISIKQLLNEVPHPDQIPFSTYASFEASCNPTQPYKKISIFLPFLPANKKSYPLRIGVVSVARITDLIGLTLWIASQTFKDLKLKPIEFYSLQIADDDGEWDNDFPALDPREYVSKFSFAHLALVENTTMVNVAQKSPYSFLLPNGTVFKTNFDELDLTIGQVVKFVLNQSGWRKQQKDKPSTSSASLGYHLEKLGDVNTSFNDPNMMITQCKCKDFCLVRDGAKSFQNPSGKSDSSAGNLSSGRSDLYPVIVSTGRFNKLKNALCIIYSGDRMDLEFQNKIKSFPLSSLTSVKLEPEKKKIILSISQMTPGVGSHYLTSTSHLTLITTELRIGTELYHHLNSIISGKLTL